MEREDFYNKYTKETTFYQPIKYTSKIILDNAQDIQTLYTIGDEEDCKKLDDEIHKNTLTIYPIKMKDYFEFMYGLQCLDIEKNKIPDIKILKMTYLDFLYSLLTSEDLKIKEQTVLQLSYILKLCFDEDIMNVSFGSDDFGRKTIIIKECVLNYEDFDNICSIIKYQNFHSHDEGYIAPELEEEINKVRKLQNKHIKPPSLEKTILYTSFKLGYEKEKIYDLTIREFLLLRELIEDDFNYHIYMKDMSFKKEVKHPLYAEKDKFDGVLSDFDNFKDKVNSANG